MLLVLLLQVLVHQKGRRPQAPPALHGVRYNLLLGGTTLNQGVLASSPARELTHVLLALLEAVPRVRDNPTNRCPRTRWNAELSRKNRDGAIAVSTLPFSGWRSVETEEVVRSPRGPESLIAHRCCSRGVGRVVLSSLGGGGGGGVESEEEEEEEEEEAERIAPGDVGFHAGDLCLVCEQERFLGVFNPPFFRVILEGVGVNRVLESTKQNKNPIIRGALTCHVP